MSLNDRIRIDVALIPSEPLFSAVIDASQAITKQFRNYNIIDAEQFPPHLSIHICTIPHDNLSLFSNDAVILNSSRINLKPICVSMTSGGYISFKVENSTDIHRLHECVIGITAKMRGPGFEEAPERKRNYWDVKDQKNYAVYGNIFVNEKFDPHFSIAKVDPENLSESFKIAQSMLKPMVGRDVSSSQLQICEIGMHSEKWDTLKRF